MTSSDQHTPDRVVTRFAPSPTGDFHVGSARTALFNYLFARKHNGTFILRSEDTDRKRSKEAYEKDIQEGLDWLGLEVDAFSRQSERGEIYKGYIEKLIDSGAAYISQEEPKEEGQRSEVIRFRNPNKTVTFTDNIRGEIEFDTTELGDFVIAKDTDTPLYHLVVVIDDHEMGVTHIIRGEDGISNTPRQILIQEAIGAPRPVYAHIPLILAPDRSKLSKRNSEVDAAVHAYKERGYLPDAMVNFLALLGWSPGGDRELLSREELVREFTFEHVHKSPAVFDQEKLNWLNREYMKQLPEEVVQERIASFLPQKQREMPLYSLELLKRMTPLLIERIAVFSDVRVLCEAGELDYFFADPAIESPESLLWKDDTDKARTARLLEEVKERVSHLPSEGFTYDTIKSAIWDFAEQEGKGSVLWPMRYALSGRDKSPDPFELAEICGKETTLRRLEYARSLLV